VTPDGFGASTSRRENSASRRSTSAWFPDAFARAIAPNASLLSRKLAASSRNAAACCAKALPSSPVDGPLPPLSSASPRAIASSRWRAASGLGPGLELGDVDFDPGTILRVVADGDQIADNGTTTVATHHATKDLGRGTVIKLHAQLISTRGHGIRLHSGRIDLLVEHQGLGLRSIPQQLALAKHDPSLFVESA
jgi:hypothetical protein